MPLDTPIRLTVTSGVPAGSGLGTSAAAAVAVLAALDAAVGRIRTPAELAHAAHALETGLGWQSGVQDQCAAAFGGIRRYDVAYPDLLGTDELADEGVHEALASQLLTVYLGRPHSSSAVHESVIASLGDRSQTVETNDALLDPLRAAAVAAVESLRGRDLVGYGAALTSAHEAARHLHPALISADADRVASIAMRYGAFGWKVNGAGGDGGSIAVLGPDDPGSLRALRAELAQTKGIEVLAVSTTALPVTVTRRPPFAPSAQREPH